MGHARRAFNGVSLPRCPMFHAIRAEPNVPLIISHDPKLVATGTRAFPEYSPVSRGQECEVSTTSSAHQIDCLRYVKRPISRKTTSGLGLYLRARSEDAKVGLILQASRHYAAPRFARPSSWLGTVISTGRSKLSIQRWRSISTTRAASGAAASATNSRNASCAVM